MFLLDSLMISGLRWVMNTVVSAAEAEMNDDTALREQLLDAEMRRETGEISDDEFQEIEADLLTRIREIKERREGGSGPLSMGAEPIETTGDSRIQIEASVSGDFHEPADAPHTTIVERDPRGGEQIAVLDMDPGQADVHAGQSLPLESKRRSTTHPPAPRRKRPASRRKLRRS
jgi:Gas vesicle protein G